MKMNLIKSYWKNVMNWKIDGKLAVCWSSNLEFTVERSTKTLVGSAVSGEGSVNVYRGTGRVLMCPSHRQLPCLSPLTPWQLKLPTSNTFENKCKIHSLVITVTP